MLKVKKIKLSTRFHEDFENLIENNILIKEKYFSIIYGPNGTGKSSICKILKDGKVKEIEIEENGVPLTEDEVKDRFFIIEDHKGRNIIKGDADDFILSSNIRREKEIQIEMASLQEQLATSIITKIDSFKIDTVDSPIVTSITNDGFKKIISSFANRKFKGKNLDWNEVNATISSLNVENKADEIDPLKLRFYTDDSKSSKSVFEIIQRIDKKFVPENEILKMEEFKDAVVILQKYEHQADCIVCDTKEIGHDALKTKKAHQGEEALSKISDESKDIVNNLLNSNIFSQSGDPFNIKPRLLIFLRDGDHLHLKEILDDLGHFKQNIIIELTSFFKSIDLTSINKLNSELNDLIKQEIEMDENDISIINNFLESSLDKKVWAERDVKNKNKILIKLGEDLVLDKEIPLSYGEQNFLSLCFEFLKAKKFPNKIIVIDDPISSFDSINKNRIAYCIAKLLENRTRLIFTHNLDLVRLMEHQAKDIFNFFIFSNSDKSANGFTEINSTELSYLLDTYKLISFLKKIDKADIINEEMFLISITSFLRSYCSISLNSATYKKLTSILHSKSDSPLINITEEYNSILKTNLNIKPYEISSASLIKSVISDGNILNPDKYPLTNRTLKHIYTYILLRLKVEDYIFTKYSNDKTETLRKKQFTLTKLIDVSEIPEKERRFLISRKTLLNEFNHFEFSLNIFQSALDIKDKDLYSEKEAILNLISIN